MPLHMKFEEYNWVAIRKFFRKTKSKHATMKHFGVSPYMWKKAVELGEIKLPKDWDCVKFTNAGNHPSKGIGCSLQDFMVSPRAEEMSYEKIANRFGCSGVNVVYHAHRLGLPNRRYQPPEYYERDWKKVQAHLNRYRNLAATGRKFSLSTAALKNRMKKGVLKRPEGLGDPTQRKYPDRSPGRSRRT